MSSASSILGLVNQLQNLEHSLTSILMELSIRLSSLTDTSVFLLIEAQEGRRFVGSRHLCDAYLGNALAPVGADVEFDVDANVAALKPKAVYENGVNVNEVPAPVFTFSTSSPASTQLGVSIGKKRKSVESQDPFVDLSKCLKTEPAVIKSEFSNASTGAQSESSPMGNDDDDDDDVIIEDDFELQDAHSLEDSSLCFKSHPDQLIRRVNDKLPVQKLEALKGISGERACTRGAVENRLSTSVCYDFGKALADAKPVSVVDVKQFFNVNFVKWVNQFTNLAPFFQRSISNGRPEGGQTFTYLGLLRQCSRTSYKQRLTKATTSR